MSEFTVDTEVALLDPALRTIPTSPSSTLKYAGHALLQRLSGASYIEEHWGSHPTFIRDCTPDIGPGASEDWVIFPGFGSACGPRAAKLIGQQVSPDSSRGFLEISPDGTTGETVKHHLKTRLSDKNPQKLCGYFHSMALFRFLWGLQDIDVEVGRMLIDSAPSSRRAVRYSKGVELGGAVLSQLPYRGGLGGEYSVALFRQFDRYGFSKPIERLKGAQHDTVTGGSPRRHTSELRELSGYLAAEMLRNWRAFEGKITPNTHIGFCHAEDHTRDRSVLLGVAAEEIAEFADKLGASFEDIPVPNADHGNTALSIKEAAAVGWFERSNAALAA